MKILFRLFALLGFFLTNSAFSQTCTFYSTSPSYCPGSFTCGGENYSTPQAACDRYTFMYESSAPDRVYDYVARNGRCESGWGNVNYSTSSGACPTPTSTPSPSPTPVSCTSKKGQFASKGGTFELEETYSGNYVVTPFKAFCESGCKTRSEIVTSRTNLDVSNAAVGSKYKVIYNLKDSFYTGDNCTAGMPTTPSSPTAPPVPTGQPTPTPRPTLAPDECSGEVNGVYTVVKCNRVDTNEQDQTKTETKADGSVTETKTDKTTTCEGSTCSTTTTTTTIEKDSTGATTAGGTSTETVTEPKTDFCDRNPSSAQCEAKTDTNGGPSLPGVPQLYEPKYPSGFSGVWSGKLDEFKQTELFTLGSRLLPNVGEGGANPSFTFDLDFGGVMNMGTHTLEIDPNIWAIIRAIVLVSALIYAYKMIFGG